MRPTCGGDTTDIIEDFVELDNGSVDVVRDDVDFGTFTNRIFRNSDIPERKYQALVFQGRYAPRAHVTLNGSWTIQLQNEGNYEGEAISEPAIPSVIGNYPEAISEARHYPTGRLQTFQRHRARIWGDLRSFVRTGGRPDGVRPVALRVGTAVQPDCASAADEHSGGSAR